jgi:hypothetical protein
MAQFCIRELFAFSDQKGDALGSITQAKLAAVRPPHYHQHAIDIVAILS